MRWHISSNTWCPGGGDGRRARRRGNEQTDGQSDTLFLGHPHGDPIESRLQDLNICNPGYHHPLCFVSASSSPLTPNHSGEVQPRGGGYLGLGCTACGGSGIGRVLRVGCGGGEGRRGVEISRQLAAAA
ncbi:hypothetical protein [Oryza sativa Japonica Group]|uniref:Uncharacterized protein n=1 Tax=Oryza sativa subsp. japonica TaxID=39947 RepID=Q8LJP1_ORYSJ|nr:hypothetical protein [Oryza sativa Japonica Group]